MAIFPSRRLVRFTISELLFKATHQALHTFSGHQWSILQETTHSDSHRPSQAEPSSPKSPPSHTMSRLAFLLLLAISATLLSSTSGMPTSKKIIFSDSEDIEKTSTRLHRGSTRSRRPQHRPSTHRTFFFPDEEPETQRLPAVPDRPRSQVTEPEVTSNQPVVFRDEPKVRPDRPRERPEEHAVIPDQPRDRPHHRPAKPHHPIDHSDPAVTPDRPAWDWTLPDEPKTPGDSPAVIKDPPVPRPSDPRPDRPPHTPGRPEEEQTSEDVEREESKPRVPTEPVADGGNESGTGGSGSGSSSGTGGNSRVHFPGEETIPVPSCGGMTFYAYVNSTGDCMKLFSVSDAGCEEGSWLVLDPDTGDAACRPRFCPSGETLFDDVCWDTSGDNNGPCAAGEGVFLDHFGRGYCDCLRHHVYWPEEERCYPVYQRGPCPAGQHLVVPEEARRAVCRPADCPDGEVLFGDASWDIPTGCYSAPEHRDDDPCLPSGGQLTIDPHTLKVACKHTQLNAVFDAPNVRCPAGSYLDFTGQCRDELVQKFRSTFTVESRTRERCTPGYTPAPNGRCVNSSLGGGGGGLGR